MNGVRQGWLVARREIRERSRSRAFLASVVLMIVAVSAMLILPALLKPGGTKNVGLAGTAPAQLAATIQQEARASGTAARIQRYANVAAGERAVRAGRIDVLVVGAQRLEWKGQPDQQIKGAVTAAIQLVTVRERAAAAGIQPATLAALLAPVSVTSVELGPVDGRSPGDQVAVYVMTGVLFFCLSVFGSMVLTGVLEEKASRVVEVLLARMPARVLLAGKIAGIGLLGLAQIGATVLAALVAVSVAHSVQIPAIRGTVLAWLLVWFVLGYLLYATVYGALGSLGSRAEDAQSLAGPASVVLIVAYFASFAMIAQPSSAMARAVSFFPLTAPMAMPGRIAMGAAAWWEPVLAAIISLVTIAGLVRLAGRIYAGAILHGGPTLGLRDAWRHAVTSGHGPAKQSRLSAGRTATTRPDAAGHRLLQTILIGTGVALGVAVGLVTRDVIIGVIVGAVFVVVASRLVQLWTRHSGPPAIHH